MENQTGIKSQKFSHLGINKESPTLINARKEGLVDPRIFLSRSDSIIDYYFCKKGFCKEQKTLPNLLALVTLAEDFGVSSLHKYQWSFPFETLNRSTGSCIDLAILFANMVLHFDILPENNVYIIQNRNHAYNILEISGMLYTFDVVHKHYMTPVVDEAIMIFNINKVFSNENLIIMKDSDETTII